MQKLFILMLPLLATASALELDSSNAQLNVLTVVEERLRSVNVAVQQLQSELATERKQVKKLTGQVKQLQDNLKAIQKCTSCKLQSDAKDDTPTRAAILEVERDNNSPLQLNASSPLDDFSGEPDVPDVPDVPIVIGNQSGSATSIELPSFNTSQLNLTGQNGDRLRELLSIMFLELAEIRNSDVNAIKQELGDLRNKVAHLQQQQRNSSDALLNKLAATRTEFAVLESKALRELGLALIGTNRSLANLGSSLLEVQNKYLSLEVRWLNRSLDACQLDKSVAQLDNRVQNFSLNMQAMGERVNLMANRSDKVDRIMRTMLQEKDRIEGLLENLTTLESGVTNFLSTLPKDCDSLYENGARKDGTYFIRPHGRLRPILVLCQFRQNSGWTVVQQRSAGNLLFNRTWSEYAVGFGDRLAPDSEYWIGNRYLYALTSARPECETEERQCTDPIQLRIEMWDFRNVLWVATYSRFEVANEKEHFFRLTIDGFEGNATDSLISLNMSEFSTIDKDNDLSSVTNCARTYSSGWWYKSCHEANLNAQQFAPEQTHVGMWMHQRMSNWLFLKKVTMMIRKTPRRDSEHHANGATTTLPLVSANGENGDSEVRTVANQVKQNNLKKERDRNNRSKEIVTRSSTPAKQSPTTTKARTTSTVAPTTKAAATTTLKTTTSTTKKPIATTKTASSRGYTTGPLKSAPTTTNKSKAVVSSTFSTTRKITTAATDEEVLDK